MSDKDTDGDTSDLSTAIVFKSSGAGANLREKDLTRVQSAYVLSLSSLLEDAEADLSRLRSAVEASDTLHAADLVEFSLMQQRLGAMAASRDAAVAFAAAERTELSRSIECAARRAAEAEATAEGAKRRTIEAMDVAAGARGEAARANEGRLAAERSAAAACANAEATRVAASDAAHAEAEAARSVGREKVFSLLEKLAAAEAEAEQRGRESAAETAALGGALQTARAKVVDLTKRLTLGAATAAGDVNAKNAAVAARAAASAARAEAAENELAAAGTQLNYMADKVFALLKRLAAAEQENLEAMTTSQSQSHRLRAIASSSISASMAGEEAARSRDFAPRESSSAVSEARGGGGGWGGAGAEGKDDGDGDVRSGGGGAESSSEATAGGLPPAAAFALEIHARLGGIVLLRANNAHASSELARYGVNEALARAQRGGGGGGGGNGNDARAALVRIIARLLATVIRSSDVSTRDAALAADAGVRVTSLGSTINGLVIRVGDEEKARRRLTLGVLRGILIAGAPMGAFAASGLPLGDDAITALWALVPRDGSLTLRSLSLSGVGLTDAGAIELGSLLTTGALGVPPRLSVSTLDVSRNGLTRRGIAALANALGTWPSVVRVLVRATPIPAIGGGASDGGANGGGVNSGGVRIEAWGGAGDSQATAVTGAQSAETVSTLADANAGLLLCVIDCTWQQTAITSNFGACEVTPTPTPSFAGFGSSSKSRAWVGSPAVALRGRRATASGVVTTTSPPMLRAAAEGIAEVAATAGMTMPRRTMAAAKSTDPPLPLSVAEPISLSARARAVSASHVTSTLKREAGWFGRAAGIDIIPSDVTVMGPLTRPLTAAPMRLVPPLLHLTRILTPHVELISSFRPVPAVDVDRVLSTCSNLLPVVAAHPPYNYDDNMLVARLGAGGADAAATLPFTSTGSRLAVDFGGAFRTACVSSSRSGEPGVSARSERLLIAAEPLTRRTATTIMPLSPHMDAEFASARRALSAIMRIESVPSGGEYE